MALVTVSRPDGSTLHSVTVARALAGVAYRQALALAWKEKGGAFALVTFC